LTYADLTGANLRGADLRGADLTAAYLTAADLWDADLTNADLTNVDLQTGNLRNSNLSGADLRGADLRGADLWNADLTDADLTKAILTDTILWGAKLWAADLTGAHLSDATLTETTLRGADVTGATLRGGQDHGDIRALATIIDLSCKSTATVPPLWNDRPVKVEFAHNPPGHFENRYDTDYFRIQIHAPGTLVIRVESSVATNGQLTGHEVSAAADSSGAGDDLLIVESVKRGLYFVRMRLSSDDTTRLLYTPETYYNAMRRSGRYGAGIYTLHVCLFDIGQTRVSQLLTDLDRISGMTLGAQMLARLGTNCSPPRLRREQAAANRPG